MAEIAKEIVHALNEEPFNRQMSLVKLDDLKPLQLLQLLNDVFATIAPDVGQMHGGAHPSHSHTHMRMHILTHTHAQPHSARA